MQSGKQIIFGEFRLDEVNECLWQENRTILLRPKAFAVLKYLLEHSGQLATKQQLLKAVWSETMVTEAVLKESIRQIRTALKDEARSPRFIETVHRRGYRFIGQLSEDETPKYLSSGRAESDRPAFDSNSQIQRINPTFSAVGLVGRQAELLQMHGWLKNMLGGERQIGFVTGEPGIGKTTLVEAFLEEVAARQAIRIGRGQCLEQYGESEAYLPVMEAISRFGRETGQQHFIELLFKHAPTWLAQMPSLINPAESEALRQQLSGATRERMLREIAEALEALSAETPLILLLEDLHWSDYSTLDLISYLARRREPARLMVIGTYRPVELILSDHPLKSIKRELHLHRLCQELALGYLTKEAVTQFLSAMFPDHYFTTKLAALIHQRTEGNPLFMVNAVDYLLDRQLIIDEQGHWQLQVELDEVELGVPENIRHLIEKQIEWLDNEERRVLEAASVVGMDCSAVAISAGLDEDVVKVEEICDKLAKQHQFLMPAYLARLPDGTITPRYKFIHVLYLDVLYKQVAATRRSRIHRQIGECGEKIYGVHAGEIAAELAVHFEQGRDFWSAVKYLRLAAENASRRFASHEAVALALRGLELLQTFAASAERESQEIALHLILKGEGIDNFG